MFKIVWDWLIGPIGRWVALGALSVLLMLGAKFTCNHYHNAAVRAKEAQRELKVYKQDQTFKQKWEGMTNEEKAEYFRSGKLPPARK